MCRDQTVVVWNKLLSGHRQLHVHVTCGLPSVDDSSPVEFNICVRFFFLDLRGEGGFLSWDDIWRECMANKRSVTQIEWNLLTGPCWTADFVDTHELPEYEPYMTVPDPHTFHWSDNGHRMPWPAPPPPLSLSLSLSLSLWWPIRKPNCEVTGVLTR